MIFLAAMAASTSAYSATCEEALAELSAAIQKHLEKDRIVGAEFLVIKSGEILLHEAYGWRDREEQKPMERDTIFNIRSMTKMLTGAGAQILIVAGLRAQRLRRHVGLGIPAERHDGPLLYAIPRSGHRYKA